MSTVECIILGFLHEGFRYGHEIDKAIEERRIRDWVSVSRMGLYKALNRLAERGLIRTETERIGKMPERNVYSLTDAGRTALQEMILAGLKSESPIYFDYGVAVTYIDMLPRDQVIGALENRLHMISDLRSYMEKHMEDVKKQVTLGAYAVMRHRHMLYHLEEDWLKWLLNEVKKV